MKALTLALWPVRVATTFALVGGAAVVVLGPTWLGVALLTHRPWWKSRG